jgi:signal peptide peptidase SppA
LSNLRQDVIELVSFPFGGQGPVVNIIRLSGVVGRLGLLHGAGISLEGLEHTIERAFRGRRLSAVALAINCPGGAPVQCASIARRIRQTADARRVPVVAFAEDIAASGGYWLACAADEIYADAGSIIGSIGVMTAGFGFPALLERHGIERRVHVSGSRKAMLDPFRPEAPEDVERLHAIQADIHNAFQDMVRTRRGDRLKGSETELFSGAVWSGREALALGLIDGLGDLRTVLRARFGEDVRFRIVGARRSMLRRRFGILSERRGAAGTAAEFLAAIDEWALWKRFGL